MQTRALGPGAPQVSAIGFGGMPLSLNDRPPKQTATEVIHAALDSGITLIDTADVYCLDNDDIGHNERLIEDALKCYSGSLDSVVVATKGGLTRPEGRWERDGRPEHIRSACEKSLQALGVDRIDLYQFHAPDMVVPFDESVGALADLQAEGKIRWVGLSNVSVNEIKEAETAVTVVTVQNRLSPFFRESLENGVVEYCGNKGIGFLAYSPVGGGRLHKKLPTNQLLRELASERNVSPHALVLAWVLAQGSSIIPIPGARTVDHVSDSAGAAGLSLSDAELESIGAAAYPID